MDPASEPPVVPGDAAPQEPEDEEPRGVVARVWTPVKGWATASPTNFGSAVIVAVLAATLPFGGWREAEEDPLATPDPGETLTVAPFEVTVERAVHGVDLGGYLTEPSTPGARHVVVELTLKNTSDETLSASDVRPLVSVRGLPAAPDPLTEGEDAQGGTGDTSGDGASGGISDDTLDDTADGTGTESDEIPVGWTDLYDLEAEPGLLTGLVPGLEYEVGLHQIVEVPAGELPEELTIRLSTLTYRQMSITDQYVWTDPVPTAEVVVPLEEAGAP